MYQQRLCTYVFLFPGPWLSVPILPWIIRIIRNLWKASGQCPLTNTEPPIYTYAPTTVSHDLMTAHPKLTFLHHFSQRYSSNVNIFMIIYRLKLKICTALCIQPAVQLFSGPSRPHAVWKYPVLTNLFLSVENKHQRHGNTRSLCETIPLFEHTFLTGNRSSSII